MKIFNPTMFNPKILYLIIPLLFLIAFSCNDLEEPGDILGLAIEVEIIIAQTWNVEYLSNDDASTNNFQDAYIEFNIDNTYDLISKENNIYSGEWALSTTKDLLVIQSDGKIPPPYNEIENEWIFISVGNDQISIRERDTKGGEEVLLRSPNIADLPRVCEDLTGLIKDKSWRVDRLVAANEDLTAQFEGFEFNFDSQQEVNAKNGDQGYVGNWNAGIRCNKFHIDFGDITELEEISSLWYLSYFSESVIKLVISRGSRNWELKLVNGENPADNFCDEAAAMITEDGWKVDKFLVGNDDLSSTLAKYQFEFADDGQLIVANSSEKFEGNWSLSNNCEDISITINNTVLAGFLNEDWQLLLISSGLMKLVSERENIRREISFSREIKDPDPVKQCDTMARIAEKELTWEVTKYQVNETDAVADLAAVTLKFLPDGLLIITVGDDRIEGSWNMKEDCKKIELKAQGNSLIEKIAMEWYLTAVSLEKMIFVYEGNNQRIEMQLAT